jgi:hypothetical protein
LRLLPQPTRTFEEQKHLAVNKELSGGPDGSAAQSSRRF